MAASVVDQCAGSAVTATGLTVHASDFSLGAPVPGDLLCFVYGTDFKAFGNGDWLPNSGWKAIPSSNDNGVSGYIGMVFHIVQSGESSWTPVNDAGDNVSGEYTCYRIQGHSVQNPILQYFISKNSYYGGLLYPMTCPGAHSLAVTGLAFTAAVFANAVSDKGLTGGVSGGGSYASSTSSGTSGTLVSAYVGLIDNITPATGAWDDPVDAAVWQQWVVQCAPGGPDDSAYIVNEEVIPSDWASPTNHVAFTTSFTPAVGNVLLFIALGSGTFGGPTAPPGWTVLANDGTGIFAAYRVVQSGDTDVHDLGGQTGTVASWIGYAYELASVQYQAEADGASPYAIGGYQTPNAVSDVGPTLCFFGVTVGTVNTNCYPSYSMLSGETPDGNGVWSENLGGISDKFVSAVSHQLTRAGGQGAMSLAGDMNNGYGITIVFSLGPVPCPTTPPASTPGTLYPANISEARVSVYNANGTVNQIEVRDDLVGGQVQYEDTPTSCGAATLSLKLHWADHEGARREHCIRAIFLTRNLQIEESRHTKFRRTR